MQVIEAMTRQLQWVKPQDSIASAARVMRDHDIGTVLVEDAGGEVRGILTDRDIACRATAAGKDAKTRVADCMSPEPLACSAHDDIYDAATLMGREQVRRLLVRDLDGKAVGILAQADVAAAIAPYGPAAEMLEEISQPGGKHSQH